jgi:hypothetical protein
MKNYQLILKKILYKYCLQIYENCFKIIFDKDKLNIKFYNSEFINDKFMNNISIDIIEKIPISIQNVIVIKTIISEHFDSNFIKNLENISGKYIIKNTNDRDIIRIKMIKDIFDKFNIEKLYILISHTSDMHTFNYFVSYNYKKIISTYSVLFIFVFILYLNSTIL